MKQPLFRAFLALLRIDRRRVVTEQNHLHALQAHHAIGLRPATIVTDRHAENSSYGALYLKAGITRLEIALFQMLEGPLGIELRMARQVRLAVFADDLRRPVGENAGVEMMAVRRQLD